MTWQKSRTQLDGCVIAIVICFSLLTIFQITPSHYGDALSALGVKGHGPIFGEARFVRTDEFALWTPFVQVAVNNQFQRFNETSIYREDLRSFVPLPLLDWAIIFKPSYWLFFVSPSLGYAFFHQVHALILVLGFYLLFRRMNVNMAAALCSTLIIWMSGYVQTWWINLGIKMAYIPWMTLVLIQAWKPFTRSALFFVIFTQQMLSTQLYPPLDATNVAIAVVLAYVIRPECIDRRVLLGIFVASILACGVVFVYLHDCLRQMLTCPNYGGRRRSGGGMPWYGWLAHFYPALLHEHYEDLTGMNICEASTIGSYLLLFAVCFVDFSRRESIWKSEVGYMLRRVLVGMGIVFVCLTIWQLAPCPWWLGAPLYWHGTSVQRLSCYIGLASVIMATVSLALLPVRISLVRVLLCTSIILMMFFGCKLHYFGRSLKQNWQDIVSIGILFLLFGLLHTQLRQRLSSRIGTLVIAIGLIGNLFAWFTFNPLQSAKPIFRRPDSPTLKCFRDMQEAHPDKILITSRFPYRVILNGYGFRTPYTAFLVPPEPEQLARLRKYITEECAPDDEIFNTYFQILIVSSSSQNPLILDETAKYWASGDLAVPMAWFLPRVQLQKTSLLQDEPSHLNGFLEQIVVGDGSEVRLHGFALSSAFNERTFIVGFPGAEECTMKFFPEEWPVLAEMFGPAYTLSGFTIQVRRPGKPFTEEEMKKMRVVFDDPLRGRKSLPQSASIKRLEEVVKVP